MKAKAHLGLKTKEKSSWWESITKPIHQYIYQYIYHAFFYAGHTSVKICEYITCHVWYFVGSAVGGRSL